MSDSDLIIADTHTALSPYGERDDVRELGDRLMAMHPAAAEVGSNAMRGAAQLALLLGANPLPGVNEVHIWKDNKGRVCMSLGVNYWRRKAEEWGGILYEVRPRMMRPDEASEYGVPNGTTAAICKGVRADDMIRFRGLGFASNDVWNMCGRVGVGTVGANEYAKQGRPPSWTALKRAETDLLRQLFPAQFAQVDRQALSPAEPAEPFIYSPTGGDSGDVIEGEVSQGEAPPRRQYTLADANRDLFGDDMTLPTPKASGNGNSPPADPGPMPDDELTIEEATAAQFIAAAAGLLETDTDTLKARLKALGYTSIPGKAAERVAAYRKLRGDMGHADDIMQPALVTVEPATRPGAEYQD